MKTCGKLLCHHANLGRRSIADIISRWKLAPNGCHEWSGTRNKGGYPLLNYKGRTRLAARLIWEWRFGPIPTGMLLCHHCDNPPCINFDHLFLGTAKDNSDDMIRKKKDGKVFIGWRKRPGMTVSTVKQHSLKEQR
jgi:hypothetical protein